MEVTSGLLWYKWVYPSPLQAAILISENQCLQLVLPCQSLPGCVSYCLQGFGPGFSELENFHIEMMDISVGRA